MKRARRDIGDTLIEVLLTIVIMSLSITALVSSLGTVANAGTAQRRDVTTDTYLRNYADSIKEAVARLCVGDNTTYNVSYQPPLDSGFHVAGAGSICPNPAVWSLPPLTLTVRDRTEAVIATMDMKVRTP